MRPQDDSITKRVLLVLRVVLTSSSQVVSSTKSSTKKVLLVYTKHWDIDTPYQRPKPIL